MTDAIQRLAATLRVQPDVLDVLEDVDPATVDTVRSAYEAARDRQEHALGEAFEGTIRLVPRPVRGRVRKLLVGS